MPFAPGPRSRAQIATLDPVMADIVMGAYLETKQDFTVVQGRRSHDEHMRNYGKGRTAAQMVAKGFPAAYARPGEAKVTWITVSTHESGKSVDLYPFYDGQVQLGNGPREMEAHKEIRRAMQVSAARKGRQLRLGIDWDGDGRLMEKGETDIVHYELKGL